MSTWSLRSYGPQWTATRSWYDRSAHLNALEMASRLRGAGEYSVPGTRYEVRGTPRNALERTTPSTRMRAGHTAYLIPCTVYIVPPAPRRSDVLSHATQTNAICPNSGQRRSVPDRGSPPHP